MQRGAFLRILDFTKNFIFLTQISESVGLESREDVDIVHLREVEYKQRIGNQPKSDLNITADGPIPRN